MKTLQQVIDWHLEKAENIRSGLSTGYAPEHLGMADALHAHLSHPVAQGEAVASREIEFGWRPLMSWALGTIDELNEGPMTADQWGEDAGLYQSARGLLEDTPTIPTGHRVVPVEGGK